MPDQVLLDLGVADVHTASTVRRVEPDLSKPAAALCVVRDYATGKVLTVSRPEPPHEMAIPGGLVDEGETPEVAATRELLEECGVHVHGLTCVAQLVSPTDRRVVHVFSASYFAGEPEAKEQGTRIAWLTPGELWSQAALYRASIEELMSQQAFCFTDKGQTTALIDAKKRASIPEREFALPELRKYPIDTAGRTRNAAARLEQMKKRGKITESQYKTARARIAKAAKKFGIDSEFNASEHEPLTSRRIHIRADLAHGGVLHVRHMTDRAFYDGEGQPVTLSDSGEAPKPVWIQLAKSGSFAGHPAGPFELNRQVFREIIANFSATKNRAIPIDYEHASESDPTSGTIPTQGAPAKGWIVDLKIDGDNLWGLVEWGTDARDQIRKGEYKFISPAIRFGTKDRVTGKPAGAKLSSAGLTNQPYLDGMEPLAAKDATAGANATGSALTLAGKNSRGRMLHAPHEYMPHIKAALKLHPLATMAECSEHLDRLRERCMDDMGSPGDGVDLSEYVRPLMDLVGAAPGMTVEELLDQVEDMIDAAMERHVEEYHEGGASMADRPNPTPGTETPTMDHATQLRDAQDKATTAEGKVATLETEKQTLLTEKATLLTEKQTLTTENATLKCTLSETEARATECATRATAAEATIQKIAGLVTLKEGQTLDVVVGELATENARLLKEKEDREANDLEQDVERAYETYKDARHLTDSDKDWMRLAAKHDRAKFHEKFKPVSPGQSYLMRVITPAEPKDGNGGAPAAPVTVEDLVKAGMSYADALIEASKPTTSTAR